MEERRKLEYGGVAQDLQAAMTEELNNAIRRNRFNEIFGAQCFVFEAWKEIVEITLSHCSDYLR